MQRVILPGNGANSVNYVKSSLLERHPSVDGRAPKWFAQLPIGSVNEAHEAIPQFYRGRSWFWVNL
jgi:hypothetical protein